MLEVIIHHVILSDQKKNKRLPRENHIIIKYVIILQKSNIITKNMLYYNICNKMRWV